MTTSMDKDQIKERSLDVLLNLPYSELDDGELERVIEWKSNERFKEKQAESERRILQDHLDELTDIARNEAAATAKRQEDMRLRAMERFEKASQ